MKESNNIFFKLQSMPEFFELGNYELDTPLLEQEMMHHNGGLWLETLKREEAKIHENYFRSYVPFFEVRDIESVQKLANRYKSIKGPSSMLVESLDELSDHISVAYQIAHFNYILGSIHYGNFPYKNCVSSSANVAFSLINFGFHNASYVYTSKGHAYVAMPFVFQQEKEEKIRGIVGIDPTSNQFWDDKNKRNTTFIRLGHKWEYRTDWEGDLDVFPEDRTGLEKGIDLFPDKIFSIDVMKTFPLRFDKYQDYPSTAKNAELYFKRAFANPVKIERIVNDNL